MAAVVKAGKSAHVVVVNAQSAAADITNLTDVTKVPVFQDVAAVDAWGLHGVGKDDILIYNSAGKLVWFLPASGPVDTALGQQPGFDAVLAALLGVP